MRVGGAVSAAVTTAWGCKSARNNIDCVLHGRNDDLAADPGDGDDCAALGAEALGRVTEVLRGETVLKIAAPMVKVLMGLAPQDSANPVAHAG